MSPRNSLRTKFGPTPVRRVLAALLVLSGAPGIPAARPGADTGPP
ncbi:hypothetical protein ACIQ9P_07190 [Kitasatospora sp. NPDC094019]